MKAAIYCFGINRIAMKYRYVKFLSVSSSIHVDMLIRGNMPSICCEYVIDTRCFIFSFLTRNDGALFFNSNQHTIIFGDSAPAIIFGRCWSWCSHHLFLFSPVIFFNSKLATSAPTSREALFFNNTIIFVFYFLVIVFQ